MKRHVEVMESLTALLFVCLSHIQPALTSIFVNYPLWTIELRYGFHLEEKGMNTKEEVLNDIAKEIYGKTYDDLRSVEQDEVYCIAEDSGWV